MYTQIEKLHRETIVTLVYGVDCWGTRLEENMSYLQETQVVTASDYNMKEFHCKCKKMKISRNIDIKACAMFYTTLL